MPRKGSLTNEYRLHMLPVTKKRTQTIQFGMVYSEIVHDA